MKTKFSIILFTFFILVGGQTISSSKPKQIAIRTDGLYSTYDTSSSRCGKAHDIYKVVHEIVFLNDSDIFYNSRMVSYSLPNYYYRFYELSAALRIGKYKIVGDSVFANIPTQFYKRGNIIKYANANYSGYIKNRDTIVGWRIVPPYPDINMKFNDDVFPSDTTPKMIYFVKHDGVKDLQ